VVKAKRPDKFTDFLRRLVRVPKREIDEQERKYQEQREEAKAAKQREIVPPIQR
jgi:hypothetical protein